jgi:type I restriction enzyme S subunit
MTAVRSEYSHWLIWVLSSSLFEFQSGRYMSSTINQLTAATLKSCPVPFPSAEIQVEIASYLDKKCAEIDSISRSVRESINQLNEYRGALITAAVTGQIAGLQ